MRVRHFLAGFCTPLLLALIVAVPNLLVLFSVGELLDAEEVVQRVDEGDTCLIGLGTPRMPTLEYKLEAYESRRPEVVVLGSSRAMQFRDGMFDGSYYNMGGLIGSVSEAERVVPAMLARHRPHTMILTVDFWWFLRVNDVVGDNSRSLGQRWIANLQATLLPAFWVADGKLSPKDYFDLLGGRTCRIGMLARIRQEGFLRDGSYFYGRKYLTEGSESFQDAYTKIDLSVSHYIKANEMSPDLFRRFQAVLGLLQDAGVNVVLLMPPVAPAVLSYMEQHASQAYRYIDQLREALSESGAPFYDFHDIRRYWGKSNCEFIDAHHPGEIMAARLLLKMTDGPAGSVISKDRIERKIADGKAYTVSPRLLDKFYPGAGEADILHIGCGSARSISEKVSSGE